VFRFVTILSQIRRRPEAVLEVVMSQEQSLHQSMLEPLVVVMFQVEALPGEAMQDLPQDLLESIITLGPE
jgi:hypothetical protein